MEGELEVEVGGGGGVEGEAVTTRVVTGEMAKTSSGGWLGVAGACGGREGGKRCLHDPSLYTIPSMGVGI